MSLRRALLSCLFAVVLVAAGVLGASPARAEGVGGPLPPSGGPGGGWGPPGGCTTCVKCPVWAAGCPCGSLTFVAWPMGSSPSDPRAVAWPATPPGNPGMIGYTWDCVTGTPPPTFPGIDPAKFTNVPPGGLTLTDSESGQTIKPNSDIVVLHPVSGSPSGSPAGVFLSGTSGPYKYTFTLTWTSAGSGWDWGDTGTTTSSSTHVYRQVTGSGAPMPGPPGVQISATVTWKPLCSAVVYDTAKGTFLINDPAPGSYQCIDTSGNPLPAGWTATQTYYEVPPPSTSHHLIVQFVPVGAG